MTSNWRQDRLPELVANMASRPRHEALRGLVAELLREGFDARFHELQHERYLIDNRGRVDVAWGPTIIELKSDLRREERDVLARMPDYLRDAAERSGSERPPIGLATDGATILAYALDGDELAEIAKHEVVAAEPDRLLGWIEPLLSIQPDVQPTPMAITSAFGRESLTFGRSKRQLERLWEEISDNPEVQLKRELWDGLLREVYGDDVGSDALFLQHTYLTILVKAIAARVLDLPVDNPQAMLSGQLLADEGIVGAVEADFFDWVLLAEEGADLVRTIANEVSRFRLADVEADVLKSLYESLIDPDERHDLGEYYTPDWLAAKVVRAAVDDPLSKRVLDPACGSGTFLFRSLKHLIHAGERAGLPAQEIVSRAADNVFGLDVHPVAVTLARVTWLLALGDLLSDRPASLSVPVFMGDAMQWNLRPLGSSAEVLVNVPGSDPLRIPAGIASDQTLFEAALDELNRGLTNLLEPEAIASAMTRAGADAADAELLGRTFADLKELYLSGRNGIWTFVLRNLLRPVWLSHPTNRADILIGNPPWIVYRHLSPDLKDRLREALAEYNLWVGGNLATHQDMCALFWARGAQRYLQDGGQLAMVLPYALMNAPIFASIRNGGLRRVKVAVTGGWGLERVWPIFGAQSGSSTTSTCVLFGTKDSETALPENVDRWVGVLPRRDANEDEADAVLECSQTPWPRQRTLLAASPYRQRFRQGATLTPRRFFLAEEASSGRLASRRSAPRMRGRIGNLDREPWSTLEPPEASVEADFIRAIALGETVAPYRTLQFASAVVPLNAQGTLSSAAADRIGARGLASWLRHSEELWNENSNKDAQGQPRMSLAQRVDAMGGLRSQREINPIRVLYTKAGTRLSACWIEDPEVIIDHKAYWAAANSLDEAAYVAAVLNSALVLERVKDLQPVGQRDPRDFDNLVWTLPIPEYDPNDQLHQDLATEGHRSAQIASAVALPEDRYFTTKRAIIRQALVDDGVSEEIERLVDALLPG